MPRTTVTQRLRAKLRTLFRQQGPGSQSALARFSQHSPGGSGITMTSLSYFLRDTPGRDPIGLDSLDDLAAFFGVSISELLGATTFGQLSGPEQRLIHAFRDLKAPLQAHVLALVEVASVPKVSDQIRLSAS
jgi:hypothetical protein